MKQKIKKKKIIILKKLFAYNYKNVHMVHSPLHINKLFTAKETGYKKYSKYY